MFRHQAPPAYQQWQAQGIVPGPQLSVASTTSQAGAGPVPRTQRPRRVFKIQYSSGQEVEWAAEAIKKQQERDGLLDATDSQASAPPSFAQQKEQIHPDAPAAPALFPSAQPGAEAREHFAPGYTAGYSSCTDFASPPRPIHRAHPGTATGEAALDGFDPLLEETSVPGKFTVAQMLGIRKAMTSIPSRSSFGPDGMLVAGVLGYSLAPREQVKENKKGRKGGKGRRHDRDRFSEADRVQLVARLKRVQNRQDAGVDQVPGEDEHAGDEHERAATTVTSLLDRLTASNRHEMVKEMKGLEVKSYSVLLTIVDLIIKKALLDEHRQEAIAVLLRNIKPMAMNWAKGFVKPLFVSEEEAKISKALQQTRMSAVQTLMEALEARKDKMELAVMAARHASKIQAAIQEQTGALATTHMGGTDTGAALGAVAGPGVGTDTGAALGAGAGPGAGTGAGASTSSGAIETTVKGMSPYKQVADLVNGKTTYEGTIELLQEELEQLKGMPVEPGWYFDQSGDKLTPPPVKCSRATDEASALAEGIRRSQLQNVLGARTMKGFKRQDSIAALLKARREDDTELHDALRDGTLTRQLRDRLEQRRTERAAELAEIKKSVLSSTSFIGHIFLQRVLPPTIIMVCLKHLLLGPLSNASLDAAKQADESPNTLSVECLCTLALRVGGAFSRFESIAVEKNYKYKPFMPRVLEVMEQLQRTGELDTRLRLLCHEVLEVEQRGWVSTRSHQATKKHASEEQQGGFDEQWVTAHTPEGYAYYYNTETGKSQWEKPAPKLGKQMKAKRRGQGLDQRVAILVQRPLAAVARGLAEA